MLQENVILNACCLKTMRGLPDGHIDLTVTSPPYDAMREYNGNSTFDFEPIARELYRVTKAGGVVVWVIGDQTVKGDETGTSFRHALFFKALGFHLFDTMIYAKPPRGACGNRQGYWQTFEYMFVFSKGKPKTINLLHDRPNKEARKGDKGTKRLPDGSLEAQQRGGYEKMGRRTNIWEYKIGNGHSASDKIAHEHPAIFPEALARDHILSWSAPGDLVFDPFSGSGTTALMAKTNARKYLGCEIDEGYCDIARTRLSRHSEQLELGGGAHAKGGD